MDDLGTKELRNLKAAVEYRKGVDAGENPAPFFATEKGMKTLLDKNFVGFDTTKKDGRKYGFYASDAGMAYFNQLPAEQVANLDGKPRTPAAPLPDDIDFEISDTREFEAYKPKTGPKSGTILPYDKLAAPDASGKMQSFRIKPNARWTKPFEQLRSAVNSYNKRLEKAGDPRRFKITSDNEGGALVWRVADATPAAPAAAPEPAAA